MELGQYRTLMEWGFRRVPEAFFFIDVYTRDTLEKRKPSHDCIAHQPRSSRRRRRRVADGLQLERLGLRLRCRRRHQHRPRALTHVSILDG